MPIVPATDSIIRTTALRFQIDVLFTPVEQNNMYYEESYSRYATNDLPYHRFTGVSRMKQKYTEILIDHSAIDSLTYTATFQSTGDVQATDNIKGTISQYSDVTNLLKLCRGIVNGADTTFAAAATRLNLTVPT